ncbi:MAG: ATP-binding protein [Deltaproteobacteria bacterium]|jgi:hypothetical protein|nr:ATP-binding protein [Deltaproteobacteria bacterium]
MTVTALEAFHSGRKELFQGLAAEKFMNSPDFSPKPVIRLDMSRFRDCDSKEILEKKIIACLKDIAEQFKVTISEIDSADAFSRLLAAAGKAASQKIVLLTDEYDTPVLSLIQRSELTYDERLVEKIRETVRSFYSMIKANDEYLDFVFITGGTKFSRMGVFSALNNLEDISTDPEFAAFLGLTQEELEVNFSPHIKKTAEKLRMSEKKLLTCIRDYYDGFSFDGETKVCNPFSALLFFSEGEFKKYWSLSGSNALIRKFLKDKKLTVEEFSGLRISSDFADSPGEAGSTPPAWFLYQAGHLTLRKDDQGSYSLDYPNFEVRASLSALFLDNLYPSRSQAMEAILELGKYPAAGGVPNMTAVFWRLYAGLSYPDHADAFSVRLAGRILGGLLKMLKKKPRDLPDQLPDWSFLIAMRKKQGEYLYRSALQSCLWGAEAHVQPEARKNRGRSDLEVRYKDQVYIMEMKLAAGSRAALKAAHDGMARIRELDCGGACKNPILISMAVDTAVRNLGACIFEKNGKTAVLDHQELYRLAHRPDTESDQISASPDKPAEAEKA